MNLQIRNLRASSNYVEQSFQYNPYPYVTLTGIEDTTIYYGGYSSVIKLPFSFCFYDSTYNKLVVGPSGLISFDTINASCVNNQNVTYPIPNALGGVPCSGLYYPRACIMACHTSLNSDIGGFFGVVVSPSDRKIEWRTEGVAPYRRFIISYYHIGSEGNPDCSLVNPATFQIILYEGTSMIEIVIENFSCPELVNDGKAICGIQNWDYTKATAVPGKNATVWTAHNEGYRFTPSGGASRFVSCRLLTLGGSLVANADTSSSTAGLLDVQFNNICPANDTTQYLVQTTYSACPTPTGVPLTSTDTITVIKNNALTVNAIASASCTTGSGSITVNALGDTFQYALDNGSFQADNIFTNVATGNHSVLVKGNNTSCSSVLTVPVNAANLSLLGIADTTICKGERVILSTISNATSYNWQPAAGLSNTADASPIAAPDTSTRYILTASAGPCVQKDTVTIYVYPKPLVNAGSDITVVTGDDAVLNGTVSNASSFLWSPPVYLNATRIVKPAAIQPLQTTLYTLTATNTSGCSSKDEVLLTVLPNCINVRNAFTPNGDGFNDTWILYYQADCVQKIQAKVYNRYGSKVYENKNYRNEWKGTYNNKPLPDGTYYYVVTVQLVTGRVYEVRGNVSIIR